ncbi:hypothetical protein RDI58_019591 [Solanum bulbocastanum]|uniref:Uncharacterized protein n=1 Tax=Solanum bulbocastanum TaxID=147425 RepID=A0AAN8Y6N8_SOLBU
MYSFKIVIPVAPPIPNSVVSVSNIKKLIPTTLDYTNYMLWREPCLKDMVSMASSMEVIHVQNLFLPWRTKFRLLILFFNNGSNLTPLFCHGYKPQSLKRYFRLLFVLTTVRLLARRGYRLNVFFVIMLVPELSNLRGRNNKNNNGNHRNYSTAPLQSAPGLNASSILGLAPHFSTSPFYPSCRIVPSPFQCQLCFQPTHTARGHTPWYVDTGASSYMKPNPSHRSSVQPYNGNDRVIVDNVLVVPTLSCNLLSVRKFTFDNKCSIDFDAFGFSIKDFQTKRILLRCNSSGPLYYFSPPTPAVVAHHAFVASHSSPTMFFFKEFRFSL